MRDGDKFSRWPIYLSLALALAMVAGVIIGARVVSNQPVSLADVDAPGADSQECTQLLDALPRTVTGHPRSALADPAPAGAAAWGSETTLRCGVEVPPQYTALMPTHDVAAHGSQPVRWLTIADPTDSSRATWYAVDRSQVVAVTAAQDPTADLSAALGAMARVERAPGPAPLSNVATPDTAGCAAVLASLPRDLGVMNATQTDPTTVVWAAADSDPRPTEPIVARCGVKLPPTYQPGVRLTQVDDVAWFTQGAVSYTVGRSPGLAVAASPAAGNEPLVRIGRAVVHAAATGAAR
ncbi:DUF3515 family protein [Corynebacterium uberis]|uniref:DUF3515 family protein n=1 Tax=Corynebacterium TaxID=1716 RepID=UPI001D0A598B|nr:MULTISPECIES: DUF3515 family protein [Corynebacterium]MCZ9309133.1 DUF3515 domain-containing protein [Corynebacterium sp. c6VSa_13]UDL74405.1 DUF3515 domain-containing protein [Corynebacterium uberis]UDL76761.1 DUF3515 domain-containing protein [Corynebacterium uberis]UDL78974.1 DUF3515 domain-containing protein [Corynebacterium uberis]UDL81251.1 DUF3515 domain-containing protein [Corynebacterium uberis]